ncbi:hypothetical protein J7I98_19870 [Streptomyces sp. ISL-98]|uniref:hypothetical protein n=1 Tax=Streptomyces sp. ISL-98 TaxID=2819192 RepID=UPI001BE52D47|nr:hypothetical protein [Streptomyces sp. ISL-98]MBT2508103.1 hypothetical protein [Streptomyces sp. ISL-98]
MRNVRTGIFAVSAAMVMAGAASAPAMADDTGAQHVITCKWNRNAGTPWGSTATQVTGYVQVLCSDRLDDANTRAQLQIYRSGGWKNHGAGVTSYSTARTIHVNDKAAKRIGSWYYRAKGTHFGQHGNVFTLPTYYSPQRSLWRRG